MRTQPGSPLDRWSALQRELGLRLSRRLFEDIARHPIHATAERRPALSTSLVLAYVLATLVYATSIAFGVVGLALLLGPWSNGLVVLLGVALVLLCVVSRPRPAKVPDDVLSADDYPALYRLSEQMARAMGARPVVGIAASADFGANYRAAGWRRRPYIELGAPLFAILAPEERVAVIAHELSHGANGDPLRGQFLFGATTTLANWASAIRPRSIGHVGDGMPFGPFVSLFAIPAEFALLGVSEAMFLVVKAFVLLVMRQSQRAEYLADLLAATVAGSNEMKRALEKTYLFETVDAALRTHALTTPDAPIGSRLSAAVAALPLVDLESLRARSAAEQWQVDTTHPPTALRVEMLAVHPPQAPSPLILKEDLQALDAEMDRLVASMQRELVNRKLAQAYGQPGGA